ncbi:NAD(P)/FAD-dependent oxidoreductase [Salisediminibacterium halotolerans]|uniref:NAD(P)/FAD-dependent oxidoreductase n=1 Tax=Salisediminibacterium halotolerans TaxID=517425 RepID=UPI000EAD0AAE|nr:FAD-dependent oxidoreductase [Salisediminibacterium halotolerans]RLJ71701.1 thioredoxin reductase [Actinophytocola xinjiangensis]RPE86851.1 thioredoxin reductase [Salisediminibacterium halotolerans]TWG32914.1 thioredoxin reductase [Salisediminibacterium halotolerans]GEL07768.1 sarcosine oxidase subunit alpha [Salisediminibacterium halotolerans]
MKADLVIIGGGPAGLAAAIEAYENGVESILVLERDRELGGILQQCIHNGFGLHRFKEELTGPEYAERFIENMKEKNIEYKLDTMVLDVTEEKLVTAVNTADGLIQIAAKAVVLAMGCLERTRGAINIPGTRASGVFTAGTAQRYVNMEGYMVGKDVVIVGSGDIGLVMARRMKLEGANVHAVVELMPYSGGLARNIVQCLNDYDIPLLLSHTVTEVRGKERVEEIVIQKVDEAMNLIPGTEQTIQCDTLLLSVGLIPENELSKKANIVLNPLTNGPDVNESMETSVPGIFACGNVVHVHDLVDWVTEESCRAGRSAARYVKETLKSGTGSLNTVPSSGVRYVVPQYIEPENIDTNKLTLMFRTDSVYENARIVLMNNGEKIKTVKKRHMAPAEMESIVLKEKDLAKMSRGEVTVKIEVEEAVRS